MILGFLRFPRRADLLIVVAENVGRGVFIVVFAVVDGGDGGGGAAACYLEAFVVVVRINAVVDFVIFVVDDDDVIDVVDAAWRMEGSFLLLLHLVIV